MNQVIASQPLRSFQKDFRLSQTNEAVPDIPGKEKLSVSSHERRAPRRRGSTKLSRNKSSDGLPLSASVRKATNRTSSGDFCTTRLSKILSGVSLVTNSKTKGTSFETAPSLSKAPHPVAGYLGKTNSSSHRDESENTAATEDLSNSSAHWTNSEIDLKEFSPPRPARRLNLETVMENMKQAHVKKLNLQGKMEEFDDILEKCHAAKKGLSELMKKYEALEELMGSDDDSNLFTSGEFSEADLESNSNSSSSYYDDEEDDDEDDEPDFAED